MHISNNKIAKSMTKSGHPNSILGHVFGAALHRENRPLECKESLATTTVSTVFIDSANPGRKQVCILLEGEIKEAVLAFNF